MEGGPNSGEPSILPPFLPGQADRKGQVPNFQAVLHNSFHMALLPWLHIFGRCANKVTREEVVPRAHNEAAIIYERLGWIEGSNRENDRVASSPPPSDTAWPANARCQTWPPVLPTFSEEKVWTL